ncbi:MAG: PfkB family carbohydrate kinase [Propionicimonas sp.]|nr:PfkB family carbohydrate kinase [Propionicimonas sp.]
MTVGGDTDFDVVLAGPVFFDIIFTGLPGSPPPGTETFAQGMGASPGGIANLAVATRRLGLRTALATVIGGDAYGRWTWELLSQEGVDLRYSRRLPDWHTSVTVSLIEDGDRAMVTHAHDDPVSSQELLADGVSARAAILDLSGLATGTDTWWRRAARQGTRLFAGTGWDPSGAWDVSDLDPLADCHCFIVNAGEAMGYARADTPLEAARWLATRVPLAVVTCGPDGAVAVDAISGEEASVPAIAAEVLDATGAGDVFTAAFVVATLQEWSLSRRLAFAALAAGLAVQNFGGALGAPGWCDIADWWAVVGPDADEEIAARYGFLTELLRAADLRSVRRADPTLRFAEDRSAADLLPSITPGPRPTPDSTHDPR